MDRLRNLFESRMDSAPQVVHCPGRQGFRPPPLKTTNLSYDDDETFGRVALSLLSRHTGYGLSVSDAIKTTFPKPEDRLVFLENLHHRTCPSTNLSPNTSSLVDQVEKTFGKELRKIAQQENVNLKRHVCDSLPRSTSINSVGTNSSQSSKSQPKRHKSRRFFADCDNVLFRSRKVQNIDFRLVEAISQVQSLCLDGTTPRAAVASGGYEAPSM
ncbi:hypothetical protein MPSEU_000644900 [Mayamaea pseudoterrestris]|nr:hypothetical protein MPSEU_000644900 [Mayamaea pseudoterrestris]